MTEPSFTAEPSYNQSEPFNELTVFEASPLPTAVVEAQNVSHAELADLFDSTFSSLFPALSEAEVEPTAPAFALYTRQPSETVDVQLGVPVSTGLTQALILGEDRIAIPSELPGGSVAAISHFGGYEGLGEAWASLMNAAVEAGLHPGLPFIEVYVTKPSPDMDPAELRTDLFLTLS